MESADIGFGLQGGDGDDDLVGGPGPDTMIGDPLGGDDQQGGDDTLRGQGGDDTLWGQYGDDTLEGGDDDDWLTGGPGDDTVEGGPGNDSLIEYGYGNDTLRGGEGTDLLRASPGSDTLYGGEGNDYFIFYAGDVAEGDSHYIEDFELGVDTLEINDDSITSETLPDGRVRVFLASSAVSYQSDDPFGPDSPFDFDGGGLFG